MSTPAHPVFRPIQTRKTFEEAVHQIAEAISSGTVRIDDRLPSERVLAEAMGVGRPTIREAFKILADAGIIELVGSGRGAAAVVRSDILPVSLVENREQVRLHAISDLLVTRRMIEPLVAQLAATNRSDADVVRLRSLVDRQRERQEHRAEFLDLDLRFHQEISRCTHNDSVRSVVGVVVRRLEQAYDLALRSAAEPTAPVAIRDHDQIVGAIAQRDAAAAGSAMFSHLRILEDLWAEESGYSFVPKLPGFLVDRT